MKLVLLGPPGAGKGTLAGNLKDKLDVVHISTGDILREEMKNNTALGQEAKQFIESGGLVPDELITRLVEKRLAQPDCQEKGCMLDGFPRTTTQAQDLDKILEKNGTAIDCVLNLEASLDVVLQRLTGRRICKGCGAIFHATNKPAKVEGVCDLCGGELYQRADDNEDTIRNRMNVYSENTKPIVDFYEKQGKLHKLNADTESTEVSEAGLKLLDEYK